MCLVSVIIPTFNRSLLLKRALDSVCKQTFSEFEIIVVDDGSTDETAEIIQTQYPNISYVYQSNQGVSSA